MQASNRNKNMVSSTLVLSIGSVVPKLLSLLTVPLLTTYLSKADYGQYDMIVSVILFVIPVITLQIEQAAFRFLLTAKDEEARKNYVTASLVYVLGICGLTGGCGAVVMRAAGLDAALIGAIVAVMVSEAVYKLAGQVVRGRSRSLTYSLGAVVYSVVYMLMVLLLIYWLRMGIIGVLLATVGGYLASSVYMLASGRTYRYFDARVFRWQTVREMLRFSVPIVPSSISLWVINFLDRLVIVAVMGAEMNAVYSVATKISQIYTAFYGIFTMAWTESAVLSVDDADLNEYYSRMFQGVFRATVGVMLGMFAVTPIVYRLLINQQYASAYPQTLLLYFGMFFNSLVSFYAGIYIALKRTRQVGYSSAVGAVINLVINLLLARKCGLYAASLSTVVSFLAIVLYRGADLRKSVHIEYKWGEMAAGIGWMVLAAVLMWKNTSVGMVACLMLAILYNLKMNLALVLGIFRTVRSLVKRQ